MQRFYDNNNNPLVGGQLFTYQAGTTTPAATYTDSTGGTPNTNPVIMNARGEASVWLSAIQAYKFVLEDASGNVIWTEDNIIAPAPVAVGGMTDELGLGGTPGFAAGVDFVAGSTTTLTLSKIYGSTANLWIHFDAAEQGADSFTLSGTTLTFNAPIPVGVNKVYVKGGTALTIGTPGTATILDAMVAANANINSSKLSFLQQGSGAVARTVQNKFYDMVSIRDFGAVGNGTTDDSAAIQAALNSGASAVYVPLGTYLCKNLNVPAHVKFYGDSEINSGFYYSITQGSWLYCTDTVNPLLTLNSGSCISGLSFYYPNQQTNAAPTVYPATVALSVGSADTMIRNCIFMNSYIAIDGTVNNHSSLWVSDVVGYPLFFGIKLDNGIDVDRLTRVMFSQKYYEQSGAVLQAWVNANATAFQINRSDTGRAENCFAYGYYYGGVNQGTNVFTWHNCAFDACQFNILIDGSSYGINISDCGFVANTIVGSASQLDAITVNSPTVDVRIRGSRFWGITGHAINILACASAVISGNQFTGFGANANAANIKGAVFVQGGSGSFIQAQDNMIDGGSQGSTTGLYVFSNAGCVKFDNNTIKNTAGQGWGIITSGSNNFTCQYNNYSNCAALNDGSGAVNKQITANFNI